MSSAISSTQIQPEFQGEDDREEERDASPHSMLYIKLLREIIQFARLEHPGLISPVDAQDLTSFEAFSNDAQMFLTCLIMRKDLKWHPIRRVMKLGGRLDLDAKGIERVMAELCENPRFAQGQPSIDDALSCLTVVQLHGILCDSRRAKKDNLIWAVKQKPDLFNEVFHILGKCIRLNLDVVRLFRRLILVYYRCECPQREGSGSSFEITEGVGKRFGAFRPLMFDDPPFTRDRDSLVEFELRIFPNQADLKVATSDSYLLIFDDILVDIPRGIHRIIDTCRQLNRKKCESVDDKYKFDDAHRYDTPCPCQCRIPAKYRDSPAVFAALCDPAPGEYALCTDEPLLAALERLTNGDLKVLAERHNIKVRGAKVKTEMIAAFKNALPQRKLTQPSRPLRETLMPDVIKKLDKSQKRRISLKPEVVDKLERCIGSYFGSRPDAPEYIARRPFHAIRRRFCE
ncbi:hypothetical protein DFH08DRAFT_893708 [Mycena albidolilacea]|uniref:Uncharacterized protein n=1 Tax=Mycena albidolilacea TaxID=1033008 RepID=A0AAD7EE08_9AGAR|nr:hypothetical protein DFH08DRAFT_893708 [Mycena albidolilacea]